MFNNERCVSILNADSYLKLSVDFENDFGFAMLVTVFKQIAL